MAVLALDGACDVELHPTPSWDGTAGTLPGPGPYRPCGAVGGQSFQVMRISADGRRVAALGTGGQVQVLDSRTLVAMATFVRARGPYTSVAISGDGTRIAAAAELDGELDVWSVDSHAILAAADLGPAWPSYGGAVAISSDGKLAAASSSQGAVDDDVATGARRSHPGTGAGALFFVDGGRKLASAWFVVLPSAATNAVTNLDVDQHDIERVEVSADGRAVVTIGERVRIWDAATGALRLDVPPVDGGSFSVVGLSADGTEAAILFADAGDHDAEWFQRRRTSDWGLVDELRILGGAQWVDGGDGYRLRTLRAFRKQAPGSTFMTPPRSRWCRPSPSTYRRSSPGTGRCSRPTTPCSGVVEAIVRPREPRGRARGCAWGP
jgi:hypothetical protein